METLLRRHVWSLHLLVIATAAALLGHATAALVWPSFGRAALEYDAAARRTAPGAHVRGAGAHAPYDKRTQAILERDIFCSSCPPIGRAGASGPRVLPSHPGRTSLPLRLLAVMYAPWPDQDWSIAVIRDVQTQDAGPFVAGSHVHGAGIVRIEPSRILLERDGTLEILDLIDRTPAVAARSLSSPPARAAATSDPALRELTVALDRGLRRLGARSFELDRGAVDALLSSAAVLAPTVRIAPETRDGRPFGLRFAMIAASSPLARLGFESGDVLRAINGIEMTDPTNALVAYTKLQSANHLSVAVDRKGAPLAIDYRIR